MIWFFIKRNVSHHRFLPGSQTDDLEAAVIYKLKEMIFHAGWRRARLAFPEQCTWEVEGVLAPANLTTPVASSTCRLLWPDYMPTSLAVVPYEILAFAKVLFVRGQEPRRGMCLCKTVPWYLQRIDSTTMHRNQKSSDAQVAFRKWHGISIETMPTLHRLPSSLDYAWHLVPCKSV